MPPRTAVRPAYLWKPERVGSFGDHAAELMAKVGRPLDPEQEMAVDAMLSYGPGGKWLTLESAIIEARQNGKTAGVLLPVVLYDLFFLPADRMVWTAHLFRTARDAFMDFVSIIEGSPVLSRKLKTITYKDGGEAIELKSGAKLEFLARSKRGGRGLGGKRIVMDEALFLDGDAMAALLPTLAARSMRGDPQVNYGSSAGIATSDHLRTMRDRGRKGGDPSLIWVEWCAPGSWDDPPCESGAKCKHQLDEPGCALDDESLWPSANHALGERISVEYIRSERRALPPLEFGRERLGWWDEPELSLGIVSQSEWADVKDEGSHIVGKPAFAIDMTPDRTRVAVAVAGRREDGLFHVEVVEHRGGTDWVAPRIEELKRKWRPVDIAIDGQSAAMSLVPELKDRKINPTVFTGGQFTQACGGFHDKVKERQLRHLGDPVMAQALKGATWRDVGGAKAFDRKNSSSDISPLVASAVAVHAFALKPFVKAWAGKR